jgi:hypothetical protein
MTQAGNIEAECPEGFVDRGFDHGCSHYLDFLAFLYPVFA